MGGRRERWNKGRGRKKGRNREERVGKGGAGRRGRGGLESQHQALMLDEKLKTQGFLPTTVLM